MQIVVARWKSKPVLAGAALSAAIVTAVLQFASSAPARPSGAQPAGFAKMQLLRDEHETMRVFLAAQEAKLRAAAAIESEPEPEQSVALAEAETEPVASSVATASKARAAKSVRVAKAAAAPPISILPPPSPPRMAHLPPPLGVEPPPPRVYGWMHDASRLPRRLWAAVGELMDERGPPIPPRPIPPA